MSAPQPDLFDTGCPIPREDTARIATQTARVRALMLDGEWRTIADVAHACGASEPGASARLRDLRKFPYHYRVERRRVRDVPGLYEYRVSVP